MPTNFLDPSADGTQNAWTKSTGTAGWSLLDDATRQPTAPTTGTDRITSSTSGQQQDIAFPDTLTFATGQGVKGWVYAIGGNRRGIDLYVSKNNGSSFTGQTTLFAASTSPPGAQWYSVDISSTFASTSDMNALQIRLQVTSISGSSSAVEA